MMRLRDVYGDSRRTIAEARMLAARGRITLAVEGDGDARFLRQWVNESVVRIVSLGGKDRVREAWRESERAQFDQLVCLADVDFDAVTNRASTDRPRFIYVSLGKIEGHDAAVLDAIDMEGVLIKSDALKKMLCLKYAKQEEIEAETRSIRERLRAAAALVGALRAALADRNSRSGFGAISVSSFMITKEMFDACQIVIDPSEIKRLFLRAVHDPTARLDIDTLSDELHTRYGHGWALCRGHDLTNMLALHLSAVIGRTVSIPEVEQSLKLAFEAKMLYKTVFCRLLDEACRRTGRILFADATEAVSPSSLKL